LWNPWIPPEFRGIGMEAELKFENIEEVESESKFSIPVKVEWN
jgi:hypothetical protein